MILKFITLIIIISPFIAVNLLNICDVYSSHILHSEKFSDQEKIKICEDLEEIHNKIEILTLIFYLITFLFIIYLYIYA